MKAWKTIAAASALALGAGAVSASTYHDVSYQGSNIFNGNAKGTVTLSGDAVNGSPNVYAGGFALTAEGLGDFVAWCLDVGANIFTSSPSQYKETSEPFANSLTLEQSAITNITRLFDKYYNPGAVSSVLNDDKQATAFQTTLWKLVYGDDLTISNFSPSGANDLSSDMFDFVTDTDNAIARVWNLTFLESTANPRSQNLVTATVIPLPAAGWLLVTGLGGLALVARRRKSAAT